MSSINRPALTAPLQILKVWVFLICCVGFAGCKKDPCEQKICNHGTCVEGNCICESGYEGDDCGKKQTAKFVGSFQAEEECMAGSDAYPVEVIDDENDLFLLQINGLWEIQDTLRAVLSANGDQFGISRQAVGSVEISGTGTFYQADSSIKIFYEVFDPGAQVSFDECEVLLID